MFGLLVRLLSAIDNALTHPDGDARRLITGAVLAIAVLVDSLARRSRASHGRA
jgi:D-xylose transport system permease protein